MLCVSQRRDRRPTSAPADEHQQMQISRMHTDRFKH